LNELLIYVSNFCRFDRQRQKKVTDFETHHHDYIDEWEQQGDLNYENEQAHTNYNFRRYLIWYAGVTRCKLKGQWTAADYAEQESSDDEDTTFDIAARHGSQIESAPILDRVVTISLLKLEISIQCFMSSFEHPNVLTCE
jgi:hypothetical protein